MAKRISKLAKKIILSLFSIIGLTSLSGCTTVGPDMYGMPENIADDDLQEQQNENQSGDENEISSGDLSDESELTDDHIVVCMYGMPDFLLPQIEESEVLKNPVAPEDFED